MDGLRILGRYISSPSKSKFTFRKPLFRGVQWLTVVDREHSTNRCKWEKCKYIVSIMHRFFSAATTYSFLFCCVRCILRKVILKKKEEKLYLTCSISVTQQHVRFFYKYKTCKYDYNTIVKYIASEMIYLYPGILKLYLGFFFPLKDNLINLLCLCVYEICWTYLSANLPPQT